MEYFGTTLKPSGCKIVCSKEDYFPYVLICTFLPLPALCLGCSPAWSTVLTLHVLPLPDESPVFLLPTFAPHSVTLLSCAFGDLNVGDYTQVSDFESLFLASALHTKHVSLLWFHLPKNVFKTLKSLATLN